MKKTHVKAVGILLSVLLTACGGDDTSSVPGGAGGALGVSGSSGTAGLGNAGTSGGSSGGSIGTAGNSGQGGSAGNGGAAGSTAGSAGTAGSGGATPDAGVDTGAKVDAATDSSNDVSANNDASTSNEGASTVDAGNDTSNSVDTGSDTTSSVEASVDTGIDVGVGISCDAGEGLQLKSIPGANSTGWVDRATNCVGIQGAVYIVPDGGGSTAFFTSVTNHICVSGTAKHNAVIDNTHWGVTVALQLNNVNDAETPYDATSHGVTGFDFTLSGANVPATVYAMYRVDGQGTEYCKLITGGAGAKTVLMTEAHPQCYAPDAGSAVPTATQLVRLEFEVPANTTTDVPFDFCIENLTAKKP